MSTANSNERMAILAERLFDGHGWLSEKAVLIEAGRIRGLAVFPDIPSDFPQYRLPDGALLAPGFIDLQVNGGGDVLLNDDPTVEAMRTIARAHGRFGTVALLPTLITDTHEKTEAAIFAARNIAGGEGVLGLHLEGPFINPARAGVHRREHIAKAEMRDLDWLRALGQTGRSLMTLAPECVPADFIRGLVDCGIRVCIGHSEASTEIVARAVEEGATGVTHLFNAMPPFLGRAPGIVGAALAEKRLTAGLIVDGFHVDPVSVRAVFAARGAGSIALVTDAMPTVGGHATAFDLQGRQIRLLERRLVTAEGTLAGAHLDMATAVRNAVKVCGIPLEDALRAASLTPARFLGLEHDYGTLDSGARADLVAMTSDLNVHASWLAGKLQGELGGATIKADYSSR